MERLVETVFVATSGIRYTSYISPSENSQKPILFLLHGCIVTAEVWSDLITSHLLRNGYGVIALDLVEYSTTDKPSDFKHYQQSSICY
jgi:alpha-beta hydrolase superfamily lysophospholipase